MPFMTEELWALTVEEGQERPTLLCHARWPEPDFEDEDAAADINWLVDLVGGIRSVRSEMNVPAGAIAPIVVIGADAGTRARFERHDAALRRLARVGSVTHATTPPPSSAQIVASGATVFLPLGDVIDLKAEEARLVKELGKTTQEIARLHGKLSNERFVANAAPEIVEGERDKLEEHRITQEKLEQALRRLRG
jgi:valyl-tRNA synthetase